MPVSRRIWKRLVILSLCLGGLWGCAPVTPPPTELPVHTEPASLPSPTTAVEATNPAGWETYSSGGQCGYSLSHPADMELASQGTYSWLLTPSAADPAGTVRNFVYVSVIPADFQSGGEEIIYNYDPVEADNLLSMQVGESRPLHDVQETAQWFTYTRLPDTSLGGQAARAYENVQPWEFPAGTKEIRYYLQADGCTYLIGGYLDAAASNQPGAIGEDLFDPIVATLRLN